MGDHKPRRPDRKDAAKNVAKDAGKTVAMPVVGFGGATKVTVKGIARAAGVSIATVSRVLNNPDLVADDKREAVLAALRSHDYIPNRSARTLI